MTQPVLSLVLQTCIYQKYLIILSIFFSSFNSVIWAVKLSSDFKLIHSFNLCFVQLLKIKSSHIKFLHYSQTLCPLLCNHHIYHITVSSCKSQTSIINFSATFWVFNAYHQEEFKFTLFHKIFPPYSYCDLHICNSIHHFYFEVFVSFSTLLLVCVFTNFLLHVFYSVGFYRHFVYIQKKSTQQKTTVILCEM